MSDSFFRHIIITTDGQEHPFRNKIVAMEYRKQTQEAGTFASYELRTIGFDKMPWKGNVRKEVY
jgi:hypothetical protein